METSRRTGAEWPGIKPLSVVLEQAIERDMVVLVDDDWRTAAEECVGTSAEVFPLWMASAAVDGIVDYAELVGCDDLEARIAFMKGRKRIACVFGNCQSQPIRELLSNNVQFSQDYWIIGMPFVQSIDEKTALDGFDETLFSNLDLFVTMYITQENKYSPKVSTDYMRSKLPEGCRVVVIPNCYFTAYFPQATMNAKIEYMPYFLKDPHGERVLPYNDCYAEVAIQNNTSIVHPTCEEVFRNLEKTITEMITREKRCDITISDYILSNYKKRRLFHTRSHPTLEVLTEEVIRLLVFLGYDGILGNRAVHKLDVYEEFIYPEVYDALGLAFTDSDSYLNTYLNGDPIDEETYLSILRLYKRPDSWVRSIDWVTRPFKRSIDFAANIKPSPTVRISSRLLSVSGSAVHLALDMTVKARTPRSTIMARLPECVAPTKAYVVPGRCMNGGVVKVIIDTGGGLKLMNPVEDGEEILIDTTWLLRSCGISEYIIDHMRGFRCNGRCMNVKQAPGGVHQDCSGGDVHNTD